MPRIFVSYRREDSAGHTGRLCDRLARRFGAERVFRDLDDIRPGQDFVEAIETEIGRCDVLVAVIGRRWAEAGVIDGRRRLDDPNDLVRLEIAAALERKLLVVPVLVQGAAMPSADALPEAIKSLARRHAVELSDSRWDYDVDRLCQALGQAGVESPATATAADSVRPTAAPRPLVAVAPELSAIRKTDHRTWEWRGAAPASQARVYQAAQAAFAALGIAVKKATPPVALLGKRGVSWRSFGEELAVELAEATEGSTAVTVRSRSVVSTTVIDYGKNETNVREVTTALFARLAAPNRP